MLLVSTSELLEENFVINATNNRPTAAAAAAAAARGNCSIRLLVLSFVLTKLNSYYSLCMVGAFPANIICKVFVG